MMASRAVCSKGTALTNCLEQHFGDPLSAVAHLIRGRNHVDRMRPPSVFNSIAATTMSWQALGPWFNKFGRKRTRPKRFYTAHRSVRRQEQGRKPHKFHCRMYHLIRKLFKNASIDICRKPIKSQRRLSFACRIGSCVDCFSLFYS